MPAKRTPAEAVEPEPEHGRGGRRMTLSEIVELLLTRGSHDRSSVSLSRNAKGETQIEVVVRTGEGAETIEEASEVAQSVYETLRARYPLASGYVTAQPPAS